MRTLICSILCACVLVLGGCNAAMRGNSALRSENFADAITAFKEHLAVEPGDWQSREKLGYAYLKSGDSKSAVPELEKVIAQEPTRGAMSYLYLGLAQLNLGEPEKALATLRSYNGKSQPLIQAEVKRIITLVEVEASKKMAREALANEAKLSSAMVKPRSFAVFNFGVPATGETTRALQKALTAMTIADLAQVEGITVIERVRLQALLNEMKLGQSGAVDPATAPKAGRLLGAENLVVGNITDPTGKIGVSSSTASTTRGMVVGSFSVSQSRDDFFELQKQVVAGILKVNNITLDAAAKASVLGQYHTRSFQAAAFYGMGLDAADRGDWQASKDYFTLAAKEDPNFGLARQARDGSPAGLGGLAGTVGAIGLKAVDAAVAATATAASNPVTRAAAGATSAGGSGGGGGGGCGH